MPDSPTNNAGWAQLFDELSIREEIENRGIFRLSAKKIKEIGRREPRLMTKFDSRTQRPKLLADNEVTILPVTNGEYVLLAGDGYFQLPDDKRIVSYDAAKIVELQTIPWRAGIRSEPQAIDTLFMASALRTFVGDDHLQLTLRGRLRSHKFAFTFQTKIRQEVLAVDGVQIEIDAGFEGQKVVIIEAKFGAVDNFLIRQLYYPYRDLLKAGVAKEICPIFLVYSNKVYSLYQFKFEDVNSYNSATLVRRVNYSLEELKPLPKLADFVTNKRTQIPRDVPFPQADDLSKVFDVTAMLIDAPANKEQIADQFGVDPRQGDYYANAASWLGFVQRSGASFEVTPEGRKFAMSNRVDRISEVAKRVCERPAFAETAEALIKGRTLGIEEIAKIISAEYKLQGTTPARRASTVRGWIVWLNGELRH